MSFYENFIKLCRLRGKAPTTVAEEVGLNNSSVTYWKRGSTPKGKTLRKLADYFDVAIDALLGDNDEIYAMPSHTDILTRPIPKREVITYAENLKIEQIHIDRHKKITITYDTGDHGLPAEDFLRLANLVGQVNEQYGFSVDDVIDLVEAAAKILKKSEENRTGRKDRFHKGDS